MKKKIYAALLIAMMTVTLLSGCQSAARNWGGTVKIELEPGQKPSGLSMCMRRNIEHKGG